MRQGEIEDENDSPYSRKVPCAKNSSTARDTSFLHIIHVWLPGTTNISFIPGKAARATATFPSSGPGSHSEKSGLRERLPAITPNSKFAGGRRWGKQPVPN